MEELGSLAATLQAVCARMEQKGVCFVSLARASRPQQCGWWRCHPETQTWIVADPFRGRRKGKKAFGSALSERCVMLGASHGVLLQVQPQPCQPSPSPPVPPALSAALTSPAADRRRGKGLSAFMGPQRISLRELKDGAWRALCPALSLRLHLLLHFPLPFWHEEGVGMWGSSGGVPWEGGGTGGSGNRAFPNPMGRGAAKGQLRASLAAMHYS